MQVTVSMLCSDGTAAASSLAINAVSAALMCSNIPWNGPLAAAQLACNASGEGTVVQPSVAQLAAASMSGIYVGTADTALLADFQVTLAAADSHTCAHLCRRASDPYLSAALAPDFPGQKLHALRVLA